MADFMIRFLICNIFISLIIGILLLAKHLLKDNLTNRMHYNLWFLLLGFNCPYSMDYPDSFTERFYPGSHLRSLQSGNTGNAFSGGRASGILLSHGNRRTLR